MAVEETAKVAIRRATRPTTVEAVPEEHVAQVIREELEE